MLIKNWKEIKQGGQKHYKTGDVEPIDLYKAGGVLHDGITWNIIKNAYRCRREAHPTFDDVQHCMGEIIHYAEMMLSYAREKEMARIDSLVETKRG